MSREKNSNTSNMTPEQLVTLQSLSFSAPKSNLHLISMFLFIVAILFLFKENSREGILVTWCISYSLILIIGAVSSRQSQEEVIAKYTPEKLSKLISVFIAFGAFCWALLPFILVPTASLFQIVGLSIVVTIGTMLNTFLIAIYLKRCIAHTVLIFLSLAYNLWLLDSVSNNLLLLAILMGGIIILFFAKMTHDVQTQSINLLLRNKEMIKSLSVQTKKADQANESKSLFLASASHDLRQPLQALTFFHASLESITPNSSSKQQMLMAKIEQSLQGLSDLLNGLLDISQLETQSLPVDKEHFPLQILLDSIKEQIEQEFQNKGLTLSIQKTNVTVFTDMGLLERILRNLLNNSLRYTHAGGVRLSAYVQDGAVLLNIEDTGIGIPKVQHEKIFSEFHQLNNPERDRRKGVGLGLSIVKQICKLLSIKISLQSEQNKGTCFTLTISLGQIEKIPAHSMDELLTLNLNDCNVLIVDNEIEVRDSLTTLLQLWGCQTMAATSGDEAIGLDKVKNADILLTDYRLKDGETGIIVADKILANIKKNIPVVLLTGDTSPELAEEANQKGYILLNKPINPIQLRSVLYKLYRT